FTAARPPEQDAANDATITTSAIVHVLPAAGEPLTHPLLDARSWPSMEDGGSEVEAHRALTERSGYDAGRCPGGGHACASSASTSCRIPLCRPITTGPPGSPARTASSTRRWGTRSTT